MELKTEHSPYAPASATNVQRTWKKYGGVAPSKDQAILDKWNYFKSLFNALGGGAPVYRGAEMNTASEVIEWVGYFYLGVALILWVLK